MVKLLGRSLGLLAALLLYGLAGTGQAQVSYDTFPGPRIDPAKWFSPGETVGDADSPSLETQIAIVSGRLQMSLTTYGATDNDTLASGVGRQSIRISDPSGITLIQADVLVNAFTVQACAANPTPSVSSVELVGTFFNDGSVGPGRTGDIAAVFRLSRASNSAVNRIEAFMYRCENGCFIPANVEDSRVFAATWTLNVARTLRMEWDATANEFRFTVDPGAASQEIQTIPYAFSDSDPLKGFDFKALRIENVVADCTTAPRKRGTITGRYDNVMLNP